MEQFDSGVYLSVHLNEAIIPDLQSLDVRRVTPTHCTGDTAIAMFAEAFGDGYIPGGAGQIIMLP